LPYLTLLGRHEGPTVALVAGVHGGKVAAVRAIESLQRSLGDDLLRGRVILVAPANLAGFQAGLAQISPDDSLNLNRAFPGVVCGLPTERLASRIMREIVSNSDYLVDLHGSDGEEAVGRFAYAARPGIDPRVDSAALRLATAWGVPTVVWDDAGPRTRETARFLQTAAHLSGVPAITVFEAGAAREDSVATRLFIEGAMALLADLQMVRSTARSAPPAAATPRVLPQVLPRRAVTSAPGTGTWIPLVSPGNPVARGELLGTLNDSTGVRVELRADAAGVVLHQRLAGDVLSGATLVILGVTPEP
jgi:predicted deacylase